MRTYSLNLRSRGARASHLDYVTKVPFPHRIFHPDAIMRS